MHGGRGCQRDGVQVGVVEEIEILIGRDCIGIKMTLPRERIGAGVADVFQIATGRLREIADDEFPPSAKPDNTEIDRRLDHRELLFHVVNRQKRYRNRAGL